MSRPFVWQDPAVDQVWPPSPAEPRIRYLRDISGPADYKEENTSKSFLGWLLGESQDELPLLTPFSVAADSSGVVWVADNGARMLYRFDPNRREIDYIQELSGTGLLTPSGVAVDEQRGRVYLSDAGNAQLFVLNMEGDFLGHLKPVEGFKRPAGLALGKNGRLYVADAMAGKVIVFSPEGEEVARVGSKVNADGRFRRPLSVAVGPAGELLVLDAMSFRVEIHDSRGELLGTIGRAGDGAGALARPKGLAIDDMGHIFVSDAAFDNIQVFDLTGNLLMYFGNAGAGPGEFNLPAGLFVDGENRLFAADSYNHRVQVFSLMH